MRLPLALAVALALLATAWLGGYRQGSAAVLGRLHEAQASAQAQAAEAAARLATLEQTRRQLSLALEDAAHADPVVHPDCLPLARVRRINLR